jgi:hypothetical protein
MMDRKSDKVIDDCPDRAIALDVFKIGNSWQHIAGLNIL